MREMRDRRRRPADEEVVRDELGEREGGLAHKVWTNERALF